MAAVETTKLSKRGQVVVPKKIRTDLGLTEGDRLIVYGTKDTIVLKKLELPGPGEFERLTLWGRKFARKRQLTRRKVIKAIQELRRENRASSARQ